MNRKGLGSHTVNTKHKSESVCRCVFSYHCSYRTTSEHTVTGDNISNSQNSFMAHAQKKKINLRTQYIKLIPSFDYILSHFIPQTALGKSTIQSLLKIKSGRDREWSSLSRSSVFKTILHPSLPDSM